MNLKGKIVEIDIYPSGSSKRSRHLKGKVKEIHTAQRLRDFDFIRIIIDEKEYCFPNDKEYCVINKVFDSKTGKQIAGRYGGELIK